MQVGLRDLDVTEHAIEANLERRDPGPCPFSVLHLGDHLPARAADRFELVERRIDTVSSEAAFSDDRGWLVEEGALDQRANISKLVEFGQQAAHQRRLAVIEEQLDARHRLQRQSKGDQVARSRVPSATRPINRSRSWTPLSVSRNLPRSVERNASSSTASSRSRMRSSAQGPQQPRAQQAAAHRRDRSIDLVQQ